MFTRSLNIFYQSLLCIIPLLIGLSAQLRAQDSNILFPIEEIEQMLMSDPYEIRVARDARFSGDYTKTAIFVTADSFFFRVKVKTAVAGGEAYNNQPRYDLAAYRFQKMFLDSKTYVVPPTELRSMPLERCQQFDRTVQPTFKNCQDVVLSIQYWTNNLSPENIYDRQQFENDSAYARHFANFNIFTYLIKHNDSNKGNALISKDPTNPRVFSVDNDVAFEAKPSDRGQEWRDLLVKKLPRATIERLQKIQAQELHRELGVVAQFKLQDLRLTSVPPTENLNRNKGVRQQNGIIQFGLTEWEITQIYLRLQNLLKKVDSGKLQLF